MGRSKTNMSKWGYADTADTACECGTSEQTMQHLLRCPLLENECSLEDLATANEKALHCARAWPNIYMTKFGDDGHERRRVALISLVLSSCLYIFFITHFCLFVFLSHVSSQHNHSGNCKYMLSVRPCQQYGIHLILYELWIYFFSVSKHYLIGNEDQHALHYAHAFLFNSFYHWNFQTLMISPVA